MRFGFIFKHWHDDKKKRLYGSPLEILYGILFKLFLKSLVLDLWEIRKEELLNEIKKQFTVV